MGTRQWPDSLTETPEVKHEPKDAHAKKTKLDCPVHWFKPGIDPLDHSWSLPENNAGWISQDSTAYLEPSGKQSACSLPQCKEEERQHNNTIRVSGSILATSIAHSVAQHSL